MIGKREHTQQVGSANFMLVVDLCRGAMRCTAEDQRRAVR